MDKVVFRKWKDGEITALFPQIAVDSSGYCCKSYEHVGQHGGADLGVVIPQTYPAKSREYAALLDELERVGYNPKVMKRCTYRDFKIRKRQAKNWGKD